jgi:hypothetical protein
MTDTIKSRAVEAMARAISLEHDGLNPDRELKSGDGRTAPAWVCYVDFATAALTALHRFATAEGARLWVPVAADEDMQMAAHRKTALWLNLPGTGLSQALSKHKLRYAAMVDAAPDPFAPAEPEA